MQNNQHGRYSDIGKARNNTNNNNPEKKKKEKIKQKQSRLLSMAKILAKHSEKTANRANCT